MYCIRANNASYHTHIHIYLYYPLYNNQPITTPDSHYAIVRYKLYFLHERLSWAVFGKTFNIGYIGQFWNEVAIASLNIKMPSYQYRDSHVKDKTVSPTVLSLTWESQYLGKTVFILRQGPADRPLANIFRWSKWKCLSYLPYLKRLWEIIEAKH